jgi:hypothetical protein
MDVQPSGRDALMDHAADVAHYLIGLEAYEGSRARALRALRGRAPGFSPAEYERALDRAVVMFEAAVKIVDKWVSASPSRRAGEEAQDPAPCAAKLRREHPGFPPQTYEGVVNWIHIYFHLM